MNDDQKAGALIVVVAVSLTLIALLLSSGWGVPAVPLHLYQYVSEDEYGTPQLVVVRTGWVLAPLVLVAAFGVLRYFSVIPPLFKNPREPKSKDQ